MHIYSTKFRKNVNLPYAKVGKQVFRSLFDAETYCGENGLDPDSAIEYGNDPELRNQCAEIAKYQKAVLRRIESRIRKQIDKLSADIEKDSERLKSCHPLEERYCEDCLHEDVAKITAMYDALKIVSDMVTELEWLSNWKD